MNNFVYSLNNAFSVITDILLVPFTGLAPVWGLVFISVLSGIALIFIYGFVSNQKAIKSVKRKISASILEVILYRHDIGLCLKAQGRMLLYAVQYFALALPPLLILMIPCIFILAQLNLRYEARALMPGEKIIVSAKVSDEKNLFESRITAGSGLEVTEPVRIPTAGEIVWRLEVKEDAEQKVSIKTGLNTTPLENLVHIGKYRGPIFTFSSASWLWSLLYPSSHKIDPSKYGISEISFSYPKAEHALFGLNLHWIIIFFIVSLMSGLVASRFLNVEI